MELLRVRVGVAALTQKTVDGSSVERGRALDAALAEGFALVETFALGAERALADAVADALAVSSASPSSSIGVASMSIVGVGTHGTSGAGVVDDGGDHACRGSGGDALPRR